MEVPSDLSLSVTSTRDDLSSQMGLLFPSEESKSAYFDASWFVKLSLQLNALDKNLLGERNALLRTWINSLPRKFDTPFHWSRDKLLQLQYPFLIASVERQRNSWRKMYDDIYSLLSESNSPLSSQNLSYDDFVWGCECARSRAFSASFTGNAFNFQQYAFTFVLIIAYLGLNLGTIEQAANGAALVICFTILKDFVLPKFQRKRCYVICPIIDMCNHVGNGESANVAFEYFKNSYTLSVTQNENISSQSQIVINYGPRSNDQLLQYYGFVENYNLYDIYVLPPLRQWDIDALEKASGRTFSSDRLKILDKLGLLGDNPEAILDEERMADDINDNTSNGVVITRSTGLDPAIMQALRILVATDEEWKLSNENVAQFSSKFSDTNENCANIVAQTYMEIELASKDTTIQHDEQLLSSMEQEQKKIIDDHMLLVVKFRLEKKKLLKETIDSYN